MADDIPEQVYLDAARAGYEAGDTGPAGCPPVGDRRIARYASDAGLRAAVESAYRAGQAAVAQGVPRLNGPMVARLRRCAADTSPNWDGAVTVYPPETRDLVAFIDYVLADVQPIGERP